MQSIKLFMRLTTYINVNWRLTSLAYLCTILSLSLNLAQPYLFSYLIDEVLIGGHREKLAFILSLSASFALGSVLLTIIRAGLFRYLGIRHMLGLRDVLLAHIRKIPMAEIEKNGAGKFSSLLGWDTASMGNFLNHIVVEMITQWFTMLFAIAMIFYMDVRLGWITLASIPVLLAIPRLFIKPMKKYAAGVRSHNEEVGTYLYESIQGSKEIRAYGLEGWERQRNQSMYKNLVSVSTKETLYRVISGQTGTFAFSLILIAVYSLGSGQVLSGALSVGMLVAAVQYLNNALQPIQVMNHFFGEMQQSEVAMNRIEQFLETPVEKAARETAMGVPFPGESSEISCTELNVSYEGTHILKGVDITVQPGQVAAFVGQSGSGKSTLFKSLVGFMETESGTIRIRNLPQEQLSRNELTKHMAILFQDSYLFSGTLYDNIAIGRLDATEEDVKEAARLANLQPLLDSMPNGLQTVVDHQGFQLSGGQRQRIAIARALLKRPNILILDEPTSALDRETEEQVMHTIKQSMKGKTLLISTHRLDIIRNADIIYVMDQGIVLDSGTHDQLIGRCRKYAALVAGQEHEQERMLEKIG
ncbi:ABC transporter ATP-binding protein [Paenibacillus sp. MMS18-CY102]|uniref:ABC transporter ATP-binding protein n=1 Tax=Paenibacillus sp. MMS18-CY102 TaxID=2682849 RepID=UPI00136588D0|nr:ABC transporter ATP-binding protein [Paenibacillus sp. MMS18-CY102]